jgi:hypothetical protein
MINHLHEALSVHISGSCERFAIAEARSFLQWVRQSQLGRCLKAKGKG